MPAKEILEEADELHTVSDSLDLLAEQKGSNSEALSILSGTGRQSATLLQVLVALQQGPVPDLIRKLIKLPNPQGMDVL
jgi:hypothetical protein